MLPIPCLTYISVECHERRSGVYRSKLASLLWVRTDGPQGPLNQKEGPELLIFMGNV